MELDIFSFYTWRIFSIWSRLFPDYRNPAARRTRDNIFFSLNLHNTTSVDSCLKQNANLKRNVILFYFISFCIDRVEPRDYYFCLRNKSGMIFRLVLMTRLANEQRNSCGRISNQKTRCLPQPKANNTRV